MKKEDSVVINARNGVEQMGNEYLNSENDSLDSNVFSIFSDEDNAGRTKGCSKTLLRKLALKKLYNSYCFVRTSNFVGRHPKFKLPKYAYSLLKTPCVLIVGKMKQGFFLNLVLGKS